MAIRPEAPAGPVLIDDRPMTVADVVRVARGAQVELASAATARIVASRRVVEEAAGSALVYGLNTGLGSMRDVRIEADQRAYQESIVISHAGAIGAPLPTTVVRAAIVTRLAGLAVGGAGASLAAAETLVAMLNRGVHPLVPTVGSVGASDLMHMAAIAVVATGLGGRAEVDGEIVPGPEALRRAGIEPFRMGPKDGLAMVSANGVAIGHAALVASRAVEIVAVADLVAAASMEAMRANPSIVDPAAVRAKPVPGQIESADRIRSFVEGSERVGSATSVQDPLSFRVVPQVHGAYREVVRFLTEAVELELAASDDNPFVSIEERRIISNGNFHPMVVALAADSVRPAAAHLGLLSDRRQSHLWTARMADLRVETGDRLREASTAGALFLRYSAAARMAELRAIVDPVTLDVPPLDDGVEDHATNATLAVWRTDEALDLLEDILAIELMSAIELIRLDHPAGHPGRHVEAAADALAGVLASLGASPSGDVAHAAVRQALVDPILTAAEGV